MFNVYLTFDELTKQQQKAANVYCDLLVEEAAVLGEAIERPNPQSLLYYDDMTSRISLSKLETNSLSRFREAITEKGELFSADITSEIEVYQDVAQGSELLIEVKELLKRDKQPLYFTRKYSKAQVIELLKELNVTFRRSDKEIELWDLLITTLKG